MWERTHRLSAGLASLNSHRSSIGGGGGGGFHELDDINTSNTNTHANTDPIQSRCRNSDTAARDSGDDEGVVLLDMDFEKGKSGQADLDSPVSIRSGRSGEGFEVQYTVGGTPRKMVVVGGKGAREVPGGEESSESESEVDGVVERRPLVVA